MPVDSSAIFAPYPAASDMFGPCNLLPQVVVDCDMVIGNELFTFYVPIEIGDFVLQMWSKAPALDFFVKVYENGQPISKRDSRFARMKWTAKVLHPYPQTLNRREV